MPAVLTEFLGLALRKVNIELYLEKAFSVQEYFFY